jgi:hypothetical protein
LFSKTGSVSGLPKENFFYLKKECPEIDLLVNIFRIGNPEYCKFLLLYYILADYKL